MAENNTSIWSQQHFALRRLHSLTGIIPVGAFLLNHMLANSTAWLGQGHFDHHIELIHSLPWLVWIEVIFIFIPLAFHGLLGLVIALQGRPNQVQYSYMDNWRYTLQRVSAYVLIPFIILHLLHYRLADWIGIAAPYADAAAAHGGAGFFVVTVAQFQAGLMGIPTWLWLVIYSIGTLAAIYHLCNGLVTFCITWGITVGDESRKKVSLVAGAVGLLLVVWAGLSLVALSTEKVGGQTSETKHALVQPSDQAASAELADAS